MNRKKRTIELESPTTTEFLRARVRTTADPTSGAVKWQLTTVGEPPSGTWVAGAWVSSSWSATDLEATTTSPDVVSSLGATTGNTYDVYIQWVVGSETPEHYAGRLEMP